MTGRRRAPPVGRGFRRTLGAMGPVLGTRAGTAWPVAHGSRVRDTWHPLSNANQKQFQEDSSWSGRIAGGDLLEIELDEPGVVVAIAALRHLEDLGAEVAGELAPGAAGLALDESL